MRTDHQRPNHRTAVHGGFVKIYCAIAARLEWESTGEERRAIALLLVFSEREVGPLLNPVPLKIEWRRYHSVCSEQRPAVSGGERRGAGRGLLWAKPGSDSISHCVPCRAEHLARSCKLCAPSPPHAPLRIWCVSWVEQIKLPKGLWSDAGKSSPDLLSKEGGALYRFAFQPGWEVVVFLKHFKRRERRTRGE